MKAQQREAGGQGLGAPAREAQVRDLPAPEREHDGPEVELD